MIQLRLKNTLDRLDKIKQWSRQLKAIATVSDVYGKRHDESVSFFSDRIELLSSAVPEAEQR